MAVTLTIPLSDQEQARVDAWLDALLPNAASVTPAQRKALLEQHAKRLLRDNLIYRMSVQRQAAAYQAMVAAEEDAVADDENAVAVSATDSFNPEVP